jgi:hypothetical protein
MIYVEPPPKTRLNSGHRFCETEFEHTKALLELGTLPCNSSAPSGRRWSFVTSPACYKTYYPLNNLSFISVPRCVFSFTLCCYFSLIKLLKSRAVERNIKVRMYRTIIRPVVTCGSETWCLTDDDDRSLRTWERKVSRKIYGPVYDNGIWRIRTNKELMALYQN